jgi:hypothetical protein
MRIRCINKAPFSLLLIKDVLCMPLYKHFKYIHFGFILLNDMLILISKEKANRKPF